MKWNKYILLTLIALPLIGAGCKKPIEDRPFTVSSDCITDGNRGCCNSGEGYFSTAMASDSDYCDKYHRTCRKQADKQCGWDKDEVARTKQCVDKKEYPPLSFYWK